MNIRTNLTTFIAGAAVLITACAFIPRSTSSSSPMPAAAAPRGVHVVDPPFENLPMWQDDKGVKPDWVFVSLVNHCKKRLDWKLEPSTHSQGIDAEPADGFKFWKGASSYKEEFMKATGTVSLWLRDGGMGDWKEVFHIEPGTAKRLEIEKSCKTVVERTDNQHYVGCYSYLWSNACPNFRRQKQSAQPEGCAEGTPSVEGDMSRTCEFPTPKGMCMVRYREASAGCDIAPQKAVVGPRGSYGEGRLDLNIEHPGVCPKTILFKWEDRKGFGPQGSVDPKKTMPVVSEHPPITLMYAVRGGSFKKLWNMPAGSYTVKVKDDCSGLDLTDEQHPAGMTDKATPAK